MKLTANTDLVGGVCVIESVSLSPQCETQCVRV